MSLKTQIVGNGGGVDDPLSFKPKTDLFNCLDDILMAHETSIVMPTVKGDLSRMHPIVLVEPKIEIKVELKDTPNEQRLIENLLQVPEVGKKSKSNSVRSTNGSVSPHSICSNESSSRRHHHHRYHQKGHTDMSNNSETNKENVGAALQTLEEEQGPNEGHRHRQHHHHHRHHHHHNHGHKNSDHTHSHNHHHHHSTTDGINGSVASSAGGELVPRPDQVLRKYIIKKITIRKQDGSTKKIIIKKPVDEPNGPLKLTKVVNCASGMSCGWWIAIARRLVRFILIPNENALNWTVPFFKCGNKEPQLIKQFRSLNE